MTIRELIAQLQLLDQDLPVLVEELADLYSYWGAPHLQEKTLYQATNPINSALVFAAEPLTRFDFSPDLPDVDPPSEPVKVIVIDAL
jgi:hypothetical protein